MTSNIFSVLVIVVEALEIYRPGPGYSPNTFEEQNFCEASKVFEKTGARAINFHFSWDLNVNFTGGTFASN